MYDMTEEEIKQVLIDNYINLLKIKAVEEGENKELEIQLETTKMKLSLYSIDTARLEKIILG
jgi:hypothetical protein